MLNLVPGMTLTDMMPTNITMKTNGREGLKIFFQTL